MYVLNIQRARLKEKLDPGNWELCLSGSSGGSSVDSLTNTKGGHSITKLIDNSGGANATVRDGLRVYSVVSGTIANGELKSDTTATTDNGYNKGGYGLVYPDLGIIVLNAGRLKERGIKPVGTMTASNTDNQFNSTLFNAISGEKIGETSSKGLRVKNADYNFSNNPTYTTGSLGALRHASMIKDPKTYITTVGMYNDKQELLATAKLSKPLLKSFDRESLIKVKLDF